MNMRHLLMLLPGYSEIPAREQKERILTLTSGGFFVTDCRQGFFSRIEACFLEKYPRSDFILYQKARVFLYLGFIVLFTTAFVTVYTILINEVFRLYIVLPETALFFLLMFTLFLLRKGEYDLAIHLFLLFIMTVVWIVIFFDRSNVVSRLDSISYNLALVTLSALLIYDRKWIIFAYSILNIIIMVCFVYINFDSIPVNNTGKIDWVVDNALSFILIAVAGYYVVTINQRALSRAEKELKSRLKAEKTLQMNNQELQASMEELEAANEEFEAMNEELMASQAELAESEEKFRLIAEKSSIGVIIAQEGKIVYVNQAVADIIGYSIDEIRAWKEEEYSKLVPVEKARNFIDIARARQKGEMSGNLSEELRINSRDGSTRWVEINSTTVTFKGKAAELVALIDITERKSVQEIIVQTEKMVTIGGLSAGMAHEINNPLGIIMQGIQNTWRRLDPESEKNMQRAEKYGIDLKKLHEFFNRQNITSYLEGIKDAGARASHIVANMLQFSRRSTGKFHSVDILGTVENSITIAEKDYDLQKSYDFRKISIIRDYTIDLPEVECIETEIEQVLLNLLKNSAQAMAEVTDSEYNPAIHITVSLAGGEVKLVLADNGPGIPEESMKHIFDPFYTTKEIGAGTGLGLSVSYFIITAHHNGSISVNSEPGRGTEFTITLPLQHKAR